MANAGIIKTQVKRARDALLARNLRPTVDAVRIELGNTGSKSTIHKYLKELEEEGAAGASGIPISEALQHFVGKLAAQVQEEADVRIAAIQSDHTTKEAHATQARGMLEAENGALRSQLQRREQEAADQAADLERTRAALQAETLARHTLTQQVQDLQERLAENDAHRQSLEEKHQQAYAALEHYRQSAKDLRDQDQRRHEGEVSQLQMELRRAKEEGAIKQNEVSVLTKDGLKMANDLSHAHRALYDQEARCRQLEGRIEALQGVEQRCATLEAAVTASQGREQNLIEQGTELAKVVRALELELAATHARLEGQLGLAQQLQEFLSQQTARNETHSGGDG